MKVYLDSCSLQRPFDDQKQVRVATETEAILGILSLWESGGLEIVGSEALEYEATLIASLDRKAYINSLFERIEVWVNITTDVEKRARSLTENGIKPLDALHLACAEVSKADYFCTCDDKFLKKAKQLAVPTIEVVSPLELVTKLPQ
ncbi:MAG: PIN domain-containing protein [Bacteroidetes bacterium]|nr:PIN domain-containing protein [Bacteroidota bacterium]